MVFADARPMSGHGSSQPLEYAHALHVPHDAALQRAYEAPARIGVDAIQLTPSEGKLIAMLLRMAGAVNVVEIGTFLGYSTIHIGRALPPGGHLWTIEVSAANASIAQEHLVAAGLDRRVTVRRGAALAVLRSLEAEGPFDACFIDADKGRYLDYGRWASAHLRPGGLVFADNVFFFGRLMESSADATPLTVGGHVLSAEQVAAGAAAMRQFHLEMRDAFDTVSVPTAEGLLIGIKK
jgi:predicted O-methyltransferase YrrM